MTPEDAAKLIEHPLERQAFLSEVRSNKPPHWRGTSNSPYYKQPVALRVKESLDKAIATKQSQIWFYKDNPTLSHTSLYLKVNQGIKFLFDYLDPDKIYYKFFTDHCRVRREHGVGIVIQVSEAETFSSQPIIEPKQWKEQLDVFVKDGVGTFHLRDVGISDEDVQALYNRFALCDNILAYITNKEIKLIKT